MTEGTPAIHRHRTAMIRHAPSQPITLLVRHGLLNRETDLLDYGCGHGGDVRMLRANGIPAQGWDPHYAPEVVRSPSTVVNLGFVLNVIEEVEQRREALRKAWDLTRKVLAVAVMLQGQASVENLEHFGDGYLTSRRTFQKYYQQAEVRGFVEAVTGVEPVSVAPGILFVFRSTADEQDFLFERRRGARPALEGWAAHRSSGAHRPARAKVVAPAAADRIADVVDELTAFALERGRLPHEGEVTAVALSRLSAERVSLARAFEVCRQGALDDATLARAAATRREDLLVHQALGMLNRGRGAGDWAPSLSRDVRALFGSRRELSEQALAFLFALSDAAMVERLCKEAEARGDGVGDERGRLVVRGAKLPELAGPLRCYVGCGVHLAGEPEGSFLVRLDPGRKRTTFLTLANERAAFPIVTSSVRVDLRRQDVRLRAESMRLVRKSRLFPDVSKRQAASERRHAARVALDPRTVFEPCEATSA